MNTMTINYTRPQWLREVIATTPVDSMLDAFAILEAIAETSSAAEHSVSVAGFDLIECGREAELEALANELDGVALELLNKIPRDEFTGAPTYDNIFNKVKHDVTEAAGRLGYFFHCPAFSCGGGYKGSIENMAERIERVENEKAEAEAEAEAAFELGNERNKILSAIELDDAEEFARGCLSSEMTQETWGFTFRLDSPYHDRLWMGADTYSGALGQWLEVFHEIANARRQEIDQRGADDDE